MLGFSKFEILGAVAGLVAVVAVPWAVLASLEAARAKAKAKDLHARIEAPVTGYIAQLERCTSNRAVLEAGVKTQNAAVDQLRLDAIEATRRGEAAVAAARDAGRVHQRRAETLMSATPRPGESPCVAAERLILESLP